MSSSQLLDPPVVSKERQMMDLQAVFDWLDENGPFATVGTVLRLSDECAEHFRDASPGDPCFYSLLRESFWASCQELEDAWTAVVGPNSLWRTFQRFPAIHSCVIRGPSDKIKELLDSPIAQSDHSPLEGFIYGGFLCTPEAAEDISEFHTHAAELDRILKTFGEECFRLAHRGADLSQVAAIAASGALRESILGTGLFQKIKNILGFGLSADENLEDLADIKSEHCYLERLGIGDPRNWGLSPGTGQVVCVLDSGADESHPMLREQIQHYARFDVYGHFKEAYACVDQACHGTKTATWICGRPLPFTDMGLAQPGALRLGIAPGAKVVSVSCLGGDLLRESATWDQFFSALQFAVDNRPKHGYEVVTICMESAGPLADGVDQRIDVLLRLLQHHGLIPVLAAGNRGPQSHTLGRSGTYVGATDIQGNPSPANGPRVDLLAPGTDLYCAHPLTPRLNNSFVGKYSGSSLAAAIVSGAIALVASAKRISARDALDLLKNTSSSGQIDIDAALAAPLPFAP